MPPAISCYKTRRCSWNLMYGAFTGHLHARGRDARRTAAAAGVWYHALERAWAHIDEQAARLQAVAAASGGVG